MTTRAPLSLLIMIVRPNFSEKKLELKDVDLKIYYHVEES